MMGGATFLIGLLPTYGTVGVLAPVLLIVLRLVQGFALGGEWGGAVLIVSEHGKPEHRGFWASWPQAGAPAGNLLATGVLALLATFQTDEAFEAWGWRIPFLLSAVLILVGLWVRLTVSESPVFLEAQRAAEARAAETGQAEKAPIVTVTGEEAAVALPEPVQTALGWVVREAVTNVLRHSRARWCTVELSAAGGEAELQVANDGVRGTADSWGNGLTGLAERLAATGGRLVAGPDGDRFVLAASVPVGVPA
jgi:MFS family permease